MALIKMNYVLFLCCRDDLGLYFWMGCFHMCFSNVWLCSKRLLLYCILRSIYVYDWGKKLPDLDIFNFSKYSQVIISENICTFGSPKKFSHQFCLPKVALQIQYNIVVDICGEFKGFLVFVILGIQPLLLSVMVD